MLTATNRTVGGCFDNAYAESCDIEAVAVGRFFCDGDDDDDDGYRDDDGIIVTESSN